MSVEELEVDGMVCSMSAVPKQSARLHATASGIELGSRMLQAFIGG